MMITVLLYLHYLKYLPMMDMMMEPNKSTMVSIGQGIYEMIEDRGK